MSRRLPALLAPLALVAMVAGVLPAAAQPPALAYPPDQPATAPQELPGRDRLDSRPGSANPYLAMLPAGVEPDHAWWDQVLSTATAPTPSPLAMAPATLQHTEQEASGVTGENDAPADAEAIGTIPSDTDLTVTGELSLDIQDVVVGADVGDATGTALDLTADLAFPSAVTLDALSVGDGSFGQSGNGTGDFDVFRMEVTAGESIGVRTTTDEPFAGLDTVVVLYQDLGDGIVPIAGNDDLDISQSYDAGLDAPAAVDGPLYVVIGGRGPQPATSLLEYFPADITAEGTGPGVGTEGTYSLTLRRGTDQDSFSVELQAGDAIHLRSHGAAPTAEIYDDTAELIAASAMNAGTGIAPVGSPFRGLPANASVTLVVPADGAYLLRVADGVGAYTLDLAVRRPGLQGRTGPDHQILFLDFDGGQVNPSIWGGPDELRTISPLSAFMPAWGLTDTDALIQAIVEQFTDLVEQDLLDRGLAGDRDGNAAPGELDVEIRNSRDHPDPWGQPNVTRLFVGGTIAEIGIGTIGIAQSIDVGNFATEEQAITLLDLLSAPASNPNSLNGVPNGGDPQTLVAAGVAYVTAHEAGHLLGSFHTDNGDDLVQLMDQGGNLPNLLGVGDDGTFGTGDDVETGFLAGPYAPVEGFFGIEDTGVHTAWAMASGQGTPTAPMTPATAVTATAVGRDLLVRWTPPADDGGDGVHANQIDVRDADGIVRSADVGTRQPAVLAGLAAGDYVVTVTARNRWGVAPTSEASGPVVVTATLPGAPTDLLAAPSVNGGTLSWTAPADDGGAAVQSYTVEVDDGTGVVATRVVPSTTTTVNGLAAGTPHTFVVRATNAAGTGPASAASAAFTPAAPPPSPPAAPPPPPPAPPSVRDVTVEVTDEGILVDWEVVQTRQAADSGFRVRALDGDVVVDQVEVDGPPALLTDVPGGVPLQVSVTPFTDAGDGETVSAAGTVTVTPLQPTGVTRIGTDGTVRGQALEVCQHLVPAHFPADRVVLARDDVFADALAGAPLAGASGCVLFTEGGPDAALDPDVRAEVDRILDEGDEVILLGGAQALSADVADELEAAGYAVTRHAGASRVETAALVARSVHEEHGGARALLASAEDFPDALVGGAFAARAGVPVLLTPRDGLHPATAAVLDELDIQTTTLLGGEAALSAAVAEAVPGAGRIAGPDRMATAAAIAQHLWGDQARADTRLVLNLEAADAWVLALAAAPLSAVAGAPQLGVGVDRLPAVTEAALEGVTRIVVVGGTGLVSPGVVAQLE